jgi:hypothetical protein
MWSANGGMTPSSNVQAVGTTYGYTTTYTDPELVEFLIDRMYERGYRNLAVGEARSTYGAFFTNREVKTVADYIGLKGKNYRIVDLSEDLEEYSYAGKLGKHFVNREWKNADFRISFAKNKTHVYAYYTLTIKNIYGALPMENKFFEYHHERDIFSTTIEFIKDFPIHEQIRLAFRAELYGALNHPYFSTNQNRFTLYTGLNYVNGITPVAAPANIVSSFATMTENIGGRRTIQLGLKLDSLTTPTRPPPRRAYRRRKPAAR